MKKLYLYHMQRNVIFLFLRHHDVLQCNNHSYLVATTCLKKDDKPFANEFVENLVPYSAGYGSLFTAIRSQ